MSAWAGRRVLVTGAGGFIGSHLAEALARDGARVRAFVRYTSSGSWGWLDESPLRGELEVIAGDVRDPETLVPAVQGAEVVFHLAALIAIPYSYTTPLAYVRTNVEGTVQLLEAARAAGVGRVVHTSTSEVYGTARYVPIDESHPLQGQSPYAASKIAADKLAESFQRSFGMPIVTLRPFNTYGPRQSARAVIPAIITQALAGRPVELGALTPTRDFTFVSDTVAGFMLAGDAPAAVGHTLNLGVGSEIAIGDLAALIARLLGRPLEIVHGSSRDRPTGSEVERLVSDNRLARDVLGWAPQVPLQRGLEQTIEWMRHQIGRYRPDLYQL